MAVKKFKFHRGYLLNIGIDPDKIHQVFPDARCKKIYLHYYFTKEELTAIKLMFSKDLLYINDSVNFDYVYDLVLPDNLTINGNLSLKNAHIKRFPKKLTITMSLDIRGCKISYPLIEKDLLLIRGSIYINKSDDFLISSKLARYLKVI